MEGGQERRWGKERGREREWEKATKDARRKKKRKIVHNYKPFLSPSFFSGLDFHIDGYHFSRLSTLFSTIFFFSISICFQNFSQALPITVGLGLTALNIFFRGMCTLYVHSLVVSAFKTLPLHKFYILKNFGYRCFMNFLILSLKSRIKE